MLGPVERYKPPGKLVPDAIEDLARALNDELTIAINDCKRTCGAQYMLPAFQRCAWLTQQLIELAVQNNGKTYKKQ